MVDHYVLISRELLQRETQFAISQDCVDLQDVEASSSSKIEEIFYVLRNTIANSMQTYHDISF